MTMANEHWNVLPHGLLTPIGANMLTVEGRIKMPLTELPRRMTVVRLRDGRLVVWSAIALDEPSMATLEAFGTPSSRSIRRSPISATATSSSSPCRGRRVTRRRSSCARQAPRRSC